MLLSGTTDHVHPLEAFVGFRVWVVRCGVFVSFDCDNQAGLLSCRLALPATMERDWRNCTLLHLLQRTFGIALSSSGSRMNEPQASQQGQPNDAGL